MKQLFRIFVALLIVVVVSASCKRKALLLDCDCDLEALLPVRVNWEQLSTPPKNVTILFYDQTTGDFVKSHAYEHNDRKVHSYVAVPEGNYTAVIVNEAVLSKGQIYNVECVGHEKFSTLRFEMSQVTPGSRPSDSSLLPYYKGQPEQLAVMVVNDIKITHALIHILAGDILPEKYDGEAEVQSKKLLDVTPLLKTYTLDLSIAVKGLKYARMNVLNEIHNIARCYHVDGDVNSDLVGYRQQYQIGNPVFEANNTDGTISTRVTSLGALGIRGTMNDQLDVLPDNTANPSALSIYAWYMLLDNKVESRSYKGLGSSVEYLDYNVTGIRNHVKIHIEDLVSLPEVEGSEGDAGWGSDLEDWGIVDVPLGN